MSNNTDDSISILEQAFSSLDQVVGEMDTSILPTKCMMCKNSAICTPIATYIGLAKLGIKVQVENCVYFGPIGTDEQGTS